MAGSDAKEAEVGGRLRWQAVDDETGDASKGLPRHQLTRIASNASGFSIRSVSKRSTGPALTSRILTSLAFRNRLLMLLRGEIDL
ncbi:hypothetical protein V1527DRAFT_454799 [Lipomyces starkeyi]